MAETTFEITRPAEAENLNMACFAITSVSSGGS